MGRFGLVERAGNGGEINFDRVAAEYDATRGGVERARAAAADLSGHLPGGVVLEIGVGTGIVADALLARAPQVQHLAGVDISAQMLGLARRRLPGCVVRGSAQRLPFPDQRFDAVIAVHVPAPGSRPDRHRGRSDPGPAPGRPAGRDPRRAGTSRG